MSFQVINQSSGEVFAETTDEAKAVMLADGLAEKFCEPFAVIQQIIRYEALPTKHKDQQEEKHDARPDQ